MTTAQRSLRLQKYHTAEFTGYTANPGEVFFDADQNTLRVFDGNTSGGFSLLKADLSNATGIVGGVTVGTTPPSNAKAGIMWLNSNTGALYVYYTDVNTNSYWVQTDTFSTGITNISVTANMDGGVASTVFSQSEIRLDGGTSLSTYVLNQAGTPLDGGGSVTVFNVLTDLLVDGGGSVAVYNSTNYSGS
jgi:hypothetical protein